MHRISEIAKALERWAPPATAQSYDNVGLQVGDPEASVATALIALDLTAGVVEEAQALRADLIVTHHPLIFRPLRNVQAGTGPGGLAYRLAASGIALYSIHTNLDAAPGGVSFALAETLGLERVRLLQPASDTTVKLVTFVPHDHFDGVREALAEAGAGQIGLYDACAFALPGTGYFQARREAQPFIGSAGAGLETVQEIRLEVEVSRWHLDRVLAALRRAHPYEEVAYDLYPVQQPSASVGMGAVGELHDAEPLPAFLERVAGRLGAASLRYTGRQDAEIRRVAVCGGAGADLIGAARRAGADAYVTADVTYHRFFDVLDAQGQAGMALIDAGHYETEAMTEHLLVEWLSSRYPDIAWHRTSARTSPVSTYVPPVAP